MENVNSIDVENLKDQFMLEGEYIDHYSTGGGHIHGTYVFDFEKENGDKISYLFQEINTNVFKDPEKLMKNIVGVTDYLRQIITKNGGDADRETLKVYMTRDGKAYYNSPDGRCWRCYNFVTDSHACQSVSSPQLFYNAAKAFGNFQRLLADYPINTLYETIPDFHNTVSRFAALKEAIDKNISGRKKVVEKEIEFALSRENDAGVLLKLLDEGKLPLRVTHNDTKLNNVLFDDKTGEGICVVDLDTVMPGLSLYDFGDSIRFGANSADEDEKDLSKVSLDMELYEQYTRGYLESAGKSLNSCEVEYLPFSAKLLTYECGIRFLTDFLNGDVYFKTQYPEHNLVRCRTQFALVADIERKYGEMMELTQRLYSELCG